MKSSSPPSFFKSVSDSTFCIFAYHVRSRRPFFIFYNKMRKYIPELNKAVLDGNSTEKILFVDNIAQSGHDMRTSIVIEYAKHLLIEEVGWQGFEIREGLDVYDPTNSTVIGTASCAFIRREFIKEDYIDYIRSSDEND